MTLLIALLGCTIPSGSTARSAASGPPSNLLFISIDTMRRDHMGRYSGGTESPFMDELAAGGLVLDDHKGCSNWTYGAMVCALSGADGVDAGFVPTGGRGDEAMPSDLELLPGLLRSEGFLTGLYTTNKYVGTIAGIERYYDYFEQEPAGEARAVTDGGLAMLPRLTGARRWMLHLHYYDPHSIYSPPPSYLGDLDALAPIPYDLDTTEDTQRLDREWDRLDGELQALILEHLDVRSRGSVRYVDDELARLFGAMEVRGLLDDTLVVIFSDHGEQFFKYGSLEHGKTLHGVEVDAVALFSGPGIGSEAWGEPTTHADIAPTTLGFLGLDPQALSPAVDLGGAGVAVGEADPDRPRFGVQYAANQSTQQSVNLGDKRLIYRWDGTRELYDLSEDPDERTDIFGADPDGERMWQLLEPRVEALDTQGIAVIP